jgi:DNA-binding HxlR family transcriptional regulator
MESKPRLLGDRCAENCPGLVRKALELIAAKWATPIYIALHCADGPLRYAELQRKLAPITPKELAKHLRQLERAGMVGRTVHPTVPPSVEYELTHDGRSLYPALERLAEWSLGRDP